MSKVPHVFGPRCVVRFAFAGMTAALLAGCADSSRFLGNPLGNPFHSASNAPPASNYDMAAPSYHPPRTPVVSRRPLPAPDYDSPRRAASYETQAHESPRLSSHYKAPRTEQTGSIAPAGGHGNWTSEGGMSVVAANGETAAVLASRYNVPTDALLRTNGFRSASQVHAGVRVIIPVYNANGGASRSADERPSREPRDHDQRQNNDHASRKRLLAERQDHERAERDEKAAKLARIKQDKAAALAEAKVHERELALAKREKAAALAEAKARDREMAAAKLERGKKDKAGALAEAKAHERDLAMAKMERARKEKVAALAEAEKKAHGREKVAAKLERQKAEKAEKAQMLADAKEARKARLETAKAEQRAKAAPHVAEVETVREKPAKGQHVEEQPNRKVAAVDPTPTASLPPASADKVSANGNPEFRWPAHGRIIQGFKSGGNDGINIAVPEGTSVKAAESGVVAYAGSEIKGFGNLVLIRHPNGYVTAYANNGDIEVHRGEQVKRGQVIAKSGQSGNVASPQLHFELRKGSTPVDPTRYLAGA